MNDLRFSLRSEGATDVEMCRGIFTVSMIPLVALFGWAFGALAGVACGFCLWFQVFFLFSFFMRECFIRSVVLLGWETKTVMEVVRPLTQDGEATMAFVAKVKVWVELTVVTQLESRMLRAPATAIRKKQQGRANSPPERGKRKDDVNSI